MNKFFTRLVSGDFPRNRVLAVILVGLLLALAFAPFIFPGVKALSVAAKVLVFIVLVLAFVIAAQNMLSAITGVGAVIADAMQPTSPATLRFERG